MIIARWIFGIAGIYGILAIAPLYFLEAWLGSEMPPPMNHPEFYYGFAGVTLAWQVAFLVIASDPARLRPMMIPAILEKLSFVAAAVVLVAQRRFPSPLLAGAVIDGMLGAAFVAAFVLTARSAANSFPKSEPQQP